eukprot:185923-Pleurochrysis_carterae.AAC.2
MQGILINIGRNRQEAPLMSGKVRAHLAALVSRLHAEVDADALVRRVVRRGDEAAEAENGGESAAKRQSAARHRDAPTLSACQEGSHAVQGCFASDVVSGILGLVERGGTGSVAPAQEHRKCLDGGDRVFLKLRATSSE